MSTEQSTWQHTPDAAEVECVRQRIASLSHLFAAAARELGEGTPREALADVAAAARMMDDATRQLVALRRADGATWQDVADDLNTTKQAAQQRYGRTR